ncbi:hypothetical protein ACI2OX_20535 [Bacillus sp. N9]
MLCRFLGAATPNGPVDFVDNITQGLQARYFLKGERGQENQPFKENCGRS